MACMHEFGLQGHYELATAFRLLPGLEYLHLCQCLSEKELSLFVNTTELVNRLQNKSTVLVDQKV